MLQTIPFTTTQIFVSFLTLTMRGCLLSGKSAFIFLLMTFLQFTHVVQAQFFQHMFGGGQAFEQREQEVPPTGDSKWFDDRVEAATCTKFLCPRTLSCVEKAAHCPCPFEQQIRCSYPDGETGSFDEGGFVCVQEPNCDRINQLRRLGQDFKMSDLK